MTRTDIPQTGSTKFRARIGDPLRGIGRASTIILPDPATLFARRAERLDTLAVGHPMEAWLRFIASLSRAQHDAVRHVIVPAIAMPVPDMPPLDTGKLLREAAWRGVLRRVLPMMSDTPDQTRAVCAALLAADAAVQDALADAYLRHAVPVADTGAALFAAAALQVWFACCAASLPVAALGLLPQRGRCPACGFAPVAGIVTAAGASPGARFLHCGLCATAWNHVRAVCTGCGESGGLALQQIAGGGDVVKAESCTICRGYAKLLYEAHDMAVEPLADDMASLGLDMLVAEAGFSRLAPNPLVIGG